MEACSSRLQAALGPTHSTRVSKFKLRYHKHNWRVQLRLACRYRNAYTQLRDCKQPAQRRSKQRAASGAQSMPQLPQLQCLVRQQGDAVQLATAGQGLNEAAAAPGDPSQGPRLPKPSKTRQGPTEHNRFTAEMDLAAAGLLDQPWEMPAGAASKSCGDRVQPGLSWPQRHKRGLKQQHKSPQQQQQQQQLLTRHLAWHQTPEQQVGSGQARVQDDSTENVSGAGRVHQKSETRAQQLSPGAKEALILAGLLSEDQVCWASHAGCDPQLVQRHGLQQSCCRRSRHVWAVAS